jgi:hypothetical protein
MLESIHHALRSAITAGALVLTPFSFSAAQVKRWPDCGPVINALEKAQAQPRLAQFGVENRDQPLKGHPMLVRIGKVEYMAFEVGGQFSHYEKNESLPTNPVLSALKSASKSGTAHCESVGMDSYLGTPATKFRFDGLKGMNPATMWIAKSSGLPLYHEMEGFDGGFAWVFGDAVKEPEAKK